jgi:DNA mismatch repair protein PMS2
MIRRIHGGTVRELAAAQAILDLSAAAKELIENSIDAGATQIGINGHVT